MKKFLIPIIGLLVLIFLTPIILGRMANSNIDTKIETFKKDGIKIKEIKKDIGYLNTNRIFEVTFDKDTKNKTWKVYHKIVDSAKFIITLKFKNLPVTKANFDVKIKYIKMLNKDYFKDSEFNVISKDFKHFKYQFKDYVSKNPFVILKGLNGEFIKDRYDNLKIDADFIKFKEFVYNKLKLNITTKDLGLYLVDINSKAKNYTIYLNEYYTKFENIEENLTTHLLEDKTYKFEYRFNADKMGVFKLDNNVVIGFAYPDFVLNGVFKNNKRDLNISFLWSETEYKKAIVGGGSIKGDIQFEKYPKSLKDINGKIVIKLDKDVFLRITSPFNPEVVNKYFKDYKSHIEIKNGEILVNGNRIQ